MIPGQLRLVNIKFYLIVIAREVLYEKENRIIFGDIAITMLCVC